MDKPVYVKLLERLELSIANDSSEFSNNGWITVILYYPTTTLDPFGDGYALNVAVSIPLTVQYHHQLIGNLVPEWHNHIFLLTSNKIY